VLTGIAAEVGSLIPRGLIMDSSFMQEGPQGASCPCWDYRPVLTGTAAESMFILSSCIRPDREQLGLQAGPHGATLPLLG